MSHRVYSKLILAYSETKQYPATQFFKDNIIGDSDYVQPEKNHPTCIDSDAVNIAIKLSNFTTSLQNCKISRFKVFDRNTGVLLNDFAANLNTGQENTFSILQGECKFHVILEKTDISLSMTHGDVELKNITDDVVMFVNGDEIVTDTFEFDPADTIIGKQYQIKVKQ